MLYPDLKTMVQVNYADNVPPISVCANKRTEYTPRPSNYKILIRLCNLDLLLSSQDFSDFHEGGREGGQQLF